MKVDVQKTCEAQNVNETSGLTVSGNGTWRMREFTSLFVIASIIGYHTGKFLYIVIKSLYFRMCEFRKNNKLQSSEFEEWSEKNHEHLSANREGSSGMN